MNTRFHQELLPETGLANEVPSAEPVAIEIPRTIATLCEVEPKGRIWLWDQWIPLGKPVLLGGPPGAGKSLLAQTICMAASIGHELYGCKTLNVPALYWTCEDDAEELNRRGSSIANYLGYPTEKFDKCFVQSLEGALRTSLWASNEPTKLYDRLDQMMGDLQLKFVALDLLPDFWEGNEIVRQEVNSFVKRGLGSLAVKHNATVMALHHPSVAGQLTGSGQSGSTAWEGSVRSRIYLEKPDKNGVRQLSLKKSNYGEHVAKNLEWRHGALQLSDLEFTDPFLKDGGRQKLGKVARTVLDGLKEEGGEMVYHDILTRFGSVKARDGVDALVTRGLVTRDGGLITVLDKN